MCCDQSWKWEKKKLLLWHLLLFPHPLPVFLLFSLPSQCVSSLSRSSVPPESDPPVGLGAGRSRLINGVWCLWVDDHAARQSAVVCFKIIMHTVWSVLALWHIAMVFRGGSRGFVGCGRNPPLSPSETKKFFEAFVVGRGLNLVGFFGAGAFTKKTNPTEGLTSKKRSDSVEDESV